MPEQNKRATTAEITSSAQRAREIELPGTEQRAMKHLDDIAEERPPLVGIETK